MRLRWRRRSDGARRASGRHEAKRAAVEHGFRQDPLCDGDIDVVVLALAGAGVAQAVPLRFIEFGARLVKRGAAIRKGRRHARGIIGQIGGAERRHDAVLVETVTGRRDQASPCDGELALIGQRLYVLHRSLAVGSAPHHHGAPAILECGGDDLGGRG